MSISTEQYKIIGQLKENPAVHCASLGIYRNLITNANRIIYPTNILDVLNNGTITFVESEGKVYGITCWHVIETLNDYLRQSENPNSHSFYTMVNGFNQITNGFKKPNSNGMHPIIDIAIIELVPEFPESIEKKAFNLDSIIQPQNIKFGYAVGFPEVLRKTKAEGPYEYLSMAQCEILAELNRAPNGRFTLHNEFEDIPAISNFSGMSGGPIFWCDGENYGIYGIAYEAGTGGELTGDKGIFVYGEYASPEEIKYWISQL